MTKTTGRGHLLVKALLAGTVMAVMIAATAFAATTPPIQSGTYKVPARDGYEFLGWYDANDPNKTLVIDKDGNWLTDFNADTRVKAKWERRGMFRFAVSIYDIGIDVDRNGRLMGLTLGPATGCAPTSSISHSVDASGNIIGSDAGTTTADASLETAGGHPFRCFACDTWAQIIAWNTTDPHVYDKCIAHDCTHAVDLFQTGSLLNANFHPAYGEGDGPGTLFYELWHGDSKYLQWSIDNAHINWGQSQTRAILNGPDEKTVATVVTNAVGDDVALIDCFSPELQAAIGERTVYYAINKDCCDTQAGVHRGVFDVTYDKLWIASADELYGEIPLGHANGRGDQRRYITPEGMGESGRPVAESQYQKTKNYNLQFHLGNNDWAMTNEEKMHIVGITDSTYNNTQTQQWHREYVSLRTFSNEGWSSPYKPWKAYIVPQGFLGNSYGHPERSNMGTYAGIGVWFCLKR